MDRVGFLDKISASVFNIYQGREWLATEGLESAGRISFQKGLTLGLDIFPKIRSEAAEDLDLIILAEYTFIGQELEYCDTTDINAITSLRKAIFEFDEAFFAFEVLQNTDGYKLVDKAFSHRNECRYRGMPKDAFHIACAGHIVRIKNILRSPGINLTEKKLLEQRRSNMITAQAVYLEKQKKILINK